MNAGMPPGKNVFEITLFGPGYGESVVLHVGNGAWIVVDSCIDQKNTPVAIDYLNRLGVDPAEAVTLVVATHWHDDHIRGMARLVAACTNAKFCCAGVLCRKEFLEVAGALEAHPSPADVRRIRSCTPNAYATARHYPTGRTRAGMVDRTLRELGVTLRRVPTSSGAIRLRRRLGTDADWKVETFGTACRLDEFAA